MKYLSTFAAATILLAAAGCVSQKPAVDDGGSIQKPARASQVSHKHITDQKTSHIKKQQHQREIPQNETEPPPESDVWTLVGENIGFADSIPKSRLQPQLERFSDNQEYFDRTLERAELYLPYVADQILQSGLPAEIALLPFVESAYNPFAYSPSGAAGLWQFIPSTGDSLDLTRNDWYDGRRDVVSSTRAAIEYLTRLNQMFDGDWLLTLAAYNAGPGTIKRAIEDNRSQGKPEDYWSLDLRGETTRYVPRLVALTKVILDPDNYGVEIKSIPTEAGISVVEVESPVDLAQAAKLANIPTDEMYHLNPGYKRWATPPSGTHQLVIPENVAAGFEENLADLPTGNTRVMQEYRVAGGDTLTGIAKKNNSSAAELATINNLSTSTVLRVGQTIMVPSQTRTLPGESQSVLSTYNVKAGDSLWLIARKNQVPLKNLLVWNDLSPNSTLKPGQVLRFYDGSKRTTASYKVRSGDSLSSIARHHKVKLADLLAWNNLSTASLIKPGQLLKVLAN